MIILATNTTDSDIMLFDLSGITISPGESLDLCCNFPLNRIAESGDLVVHIASGALTIGDGTTTFSIAEAIQYVTIQNIMAGPKNNSGLLRVHSTPRPLGTLTKFIGKGDDPTTPLVYGTGTALTYRHTIGDPTTYNMYFDLNTISNPTYLKEGAMQWQGALFDTISMNIVPHVAQVAPGSNTNYNVYGGYMIVPAPGNGTVNITSDITKANGGLFQVLANDLGIKSPGYWNATWNSSTKLFENITPAPNADGNFNLFCYEATLSTYAIKLPMLGAGSVVLGSDDVDIFPHGARIKFTITTTGADHEWAFCAILSVFRTVR